MVEHSLRSVFVVLLIVVLHLVRGSTRRGRGGARLLGCLLRRSEVLLLVHLVLVEHLHEVNVLFLVVQPRQEVVLVG